MSINQLVNRASVLVDGDTILSNEATTLLQLPPTITKSVNILAGAKIGSTLTYTVVITNLNLSSMPNVSFTDPLPNGCEFITGTFKVNGSTVSPTYNAGENKITHTIASIGSLGVVTITFQVKVIAQEDEET